MSTFEFKHITASSPSGSLERDCEREREVISLKQHERNQSLPNAPSARSQDGQLLHTGRPTRAATFSRSRGPSLSSSTGVGASNVTMGPGVTPRSRDVLMERNNATYPLSTDFSTSNDEMGQQKLHISSNNVSPTVSSVVNTPTSYLSHHQHAVSLAMPQNDIEPPPEAHRSFSVPTSVSNANIQGEADKTAVVQNGGPLQRQSTATKSKAEPKTPSEYALHILFTQVS